MGWQGPITYRQYLVWMTYLGTPVLTERDIAEREEMELQMSKSAWFAVTGYTGPQDETSDGH